MKGLQRPSAPAFRFVIPPRTRGVISPSNLSQRQLRKARARAVLMVIVFRELNGTSVHGSLQTAIARFAYLGHT